MILHHLSQKCSGGGPPDPLILHICNIKTSMSNACFVERGLQLYKKNNAPTVINLYVNNCLESRFKSYICRRERTTTNPLFLLFLVYLLLFFFFFCFSKFNESLDPLTKIPGSAPAVDAPFLVQNGRVCGVGDRYIITCINCISPDLACFYQFTVFMSTAHSVADRAERRD